jgi:aminomethyltransferase
MQQTPLYPLHLAKAAKIIDFAGFAMPLVYQSTVVECQAARSQAVLFDVSHMGQLEYIGQPEALAVLEKILPIDLSLLPVGKSRYSFFLNAQGGIVDDVIVSRLAENTVALVVNAARKTAVLDHLQRHFAAELTKSGVAFQVREDLALLAVQGPAAAAVLTPLYPEVTQMFFMQNRVLGDAVLYRSGYTGEDGFEIRLPAAQALALAEKLLQHQALQLAGLAARDVLRLEAGLCLYGQDLSESITPVDAGLLWAIPKSRRQSGGFWGADALASGEKNHGYQRLGLLPEGKAPLRAGSPLRTAEGEQVGFISSGGFSVTLQRPIAMGYVAALMDGVPLFSELRGQKIACEVQPLPFVPHRYRLA